MIQDNNVINLLESAMKAEGLRQQAIANNIANLNTSGYRRYDINFQDALDQAMGRGDTFNPDKMDLELVQPKNTPLNDRGNDVSLDSEVAQMVKNSLRHRAFMAILKKKYQQMDMAVRIP